MEPTPELIEGHAAAMEKRRRRLRDAAGLDPGQKRQAEFILDYRYWRADRWDVESRWKPHVAKELCPGSNPWHPHPAFLNCTTEAIARNACRTLRKNFPGKQYRFRPSDGSMRRETDSQNPPSPPPGGLFYFL